MEFSNEIVQKMVNRLSDILLFIPMKSEKCEKSFLEEVLREVADCIQLFSSYLKLDSQPSDWDITVARLQKLEKTLQELHDQLNKAS
jgi:cob(I)alamin adenosyltransferase